MAGCISRRGFLKDAALGTGLLTAAMAGSTASRAVASEAESYTYADTIAWDAEYDVVVVGFGGAGASAAIHAADAGASVLICDVAPEGHEGGNTRYCAQLVCGTTDEEAMKTYLRSLAWKFSYDEEIIDVMAKGLAEMPEILKGLGAEEPVQLPNGSLSIAPEYPEAPGGESVVSWTVHQGIFDSALWQLLRKGVMDRLDSVSVWYESPARHLIQDPQTKTVVGVEIEKQGEAVCVRAKNGVVMACGGFENNQEMAQDYLGVPRVAPYGTLYNKGDGHRMAMEIGADLWHMECYESLGLYAAYAWEVGEGQRAMFERPDILGASPLLASSGKYGQGSIVFVGDDGGRFVCEDGANRHGHLYDCGAWRIPAANYRPHAVFDAAQLDELRAEALITPEKEGLLISASSVAELAEKIGADPAILQRTLDDFNFFAGQGVDYKCGRTAESMRAFEGDALYAIAMCPAVLNTQGGPRRNAEAQVIDVNGNPIPHLYSAGEFGGITVFHYNGGMNIAECLVFGAIAGRGAAEPKDDLAALAVPMRVDADAKYGLGKGDFQMVDAGAIELADNERTGTCPRGIGGEIAVKVTIDGERIVAVEILKENETPEIGGVALEKMVAEVVETGSTDVDLVAGATVTGTVFLEAIQNALSA